MIQNSHLIDYYSFFNFIALLLYNVIITDMETIDTAKKMSPAETAAQDIESRFPHPRVHMGFQAAELQSHEKELTQELPATLTPYATIAEGVRAGFFNPTKVSEEELTKPVDPFAQKTEPEPNDEADIRRLRQLQGEAYHGLQDALRAFRAIEEYIKPYRLDLRDYCQPIESMLQEIGPDVSVLEARGNVRYRNSKLFLADVSKYFFDESPRGAKAMYQMVAGDHQAFDDLFEAKSGPAIAGLRKWQAYVHASGAFNTAVLERQSPELKAVGAKMVDAAVRASGADGVDRRSSFTEEYPKPDLLLSYAVRSVHRLGKAYEQGIQASADNDGFVSPEALAAYLRHCMQEAADEVKLLRERMIPAEDYQLFMQALQNPPKTTEGPKQASKEYGSVPTVGARVGGMVSSLKAKVAGWFGKKNA